MSEEESQSDKQPEQKKAEPLESGDLEEIVPELAKLP
jgi:hypothetical protein